MATSLFAAPLGIPIFRWYNANGDPAAAYQVQTWAAGTSTPLATYPTYADALAGTNPNSNPVVLDANGAAQIWVQASFYKIAVLLPVAQGGAAVYTQDFAMPAGGFPQPYVTEWTPLSVLTAGAPAFASTTSFTVAGVDVTGTFTQGRRVRTQNTGGTVYSTVTSSSFAANTTVNLVNDSGVLDAGLSAVYYGFNAYQSPSYLDPRTVLYVIKNGNQTGFAASTKLTTWSVGNDNLSEWVAGSNHWLCKYPGLYKITAQIAYSNTAASIQHFLQIATTTGTVLKRSEQRSYSVATNIMTLTADYVVSLGASSTISVFVQGDANTTVAGPATGDTSLSIVRIP